MKFNAWTLSLMSAGLVTLPAVVHDDERTNAVLQEAKSRGDMALFWSWVKELRGFYSRSDVPQSIFGRDGVLRSDPVEILREWRAFYEQIGNEPDDAP